MSPDRPLSLTTDSTDRPTHKLKKDPYKMIDSKLPPHISSLLIDISVDACFLACLPACLLSVAVCLSWLLAGWLLTDRWCPRFPSWNQPWVEDRLGTTSSGLLACSQVVLKENNLS